MNVRPEVLQHQSLGIIGPTWLVVHGTDVIAFCPTPMKAEMVADALALYADLGPGDDDHKVAA